MYNSILYKIKSLWDDFKYNITHVTNARIKIIITFLIVLLLFYLFDFLTKILIFDPNHIYGSLNSKVIDWGVIGFRSIPHDNSTLFSSLNVNIPLYAHYIINFSLAFAFTMPIFFIKHYSVAVGLAILVSGVLGNTIDKIWTTKAVVFNGREVTNYVIDILYLPWYDRGTFNFADVFIIAGSSLLLIHFLIGIYKDVVKK